MQIDLTKLTPGQIAVITGVATLMAATLGGFFALTVALVNAWSARRIAKANSLREFRLKLFEPYLTTHDEEIRLIRGTLTLMVTITRQDVSVAIIIVERLRSRSRASRIWNVLSMSPMKTPVSPYVCCA